MCWERTSTVPSPFPVMINNTYLNWYELGTTVVILIAIAWLAVMVESLSTIKSWCAHSGHQRGGRQITLQRMVVLRNGRFKEIWL